MRSPRKPQSLDWDLHARYIDGKQSARQRLYADSASLPIPHSKEGENVESTRVRQSRIGAAQFASFRALEPVRTNLTAFFLDRSCTSFSSWGNFCTSSMTIIRSLPVSYSRMRCGALLNFAKVSLSSRL